MPRRPVALLDLDGTLVDSVYHHVITWAQALQEHGRDVPLWRIHAGVGMGSDRLLPWLLGEHAEEADAITESHTRRFLALAKDLRVTPGAHALLDDLVTREVPFSIATSASPDELEALLSALGRDDLPTTGAGDVEESKPYPNILEAALAELDADVEDVTLIGDSPWDAEAATRIGVRTIGVRCGGFADEALLGAGADAVVDAPRDLVGRL